MFFLPDPVNQPGFVHVGPLTMQGSPPGAGSTANRRDWIFILHTSFSPATPASGINNQSEVLHILPGNGGGVGMPPFSRSTDPPVLGHPFIKFQFHTAPSAPFRTIRFSRPLLPA